MRNAVQSFQALDSPKRLFCDRKFGDGSSAVNAICSRSEVADDVISCEDEETFQAYVCIILCINKHFSGLRENRNQPFK